MAQEVLTCAKCGRSRYASRMRRVSAYGHRFSICLAVASCKVYARKKGGQQA